MFYNIIKKLKIKLILSEIRLLNPSKRSRSLKTDKWSTDKWSGFADRVAKETLLTTCSATWIKQSLCLHMSLIDSASEVEEVALVKEKLWRSPHLRFYSPCTVRVEKSRSENGRGGLSERAQKYLVLKNHSSWRHRSASFQRCCERGN